MSEPGTEIRRRFEVQLGNGRTSHRKLREGKPEPLSENPPGPSRLARLPALAHDFDGLIRGGQVKDQAERAMLCHGRRARVTQIMNLPFLAPDTQEEILFSMAGSEGEDVLSLGRIRRVAAEPGWGGQRELWHALR